MVIFSVYCHFIVAPSQTQQAAGLQHHLDMHSDAE
jgi:hypothetical protein